MLICHEKTRATKEVHGTYLFWAKTLLTANNYPQSWEYHLCFAIFIFFRESYLGHEIKKSGLALFMLLKERKSALGKVQVRYR